MPSTMSWVGDVIGRPCAGDRMLFEDSIRMRASACASADSGRGTALWAPSKAGVEAPPNNRGGREGLYTEAVQRWCAVQQHRVLRDDLFEDIPHLGTLTFHHALGALDVLRVV